MGIPSGGRPARRLRAAALLLSLLTPVRASAEPTAAEFHAGILAAKTRQEVLLGRLGALKERYPGGDLDRLALERGVLRGEMNDVLQEFLNIRKDLVVLRKEQTLAHLALLVGTPPKSALDESLRRTADFERYFADMRGFEDRVGRAWKEDDDAFEAALYAARKARRERNGRLTKWALGALSALAAFALWRRLRAPPPQAAPLPAPAPAAPPRPAVVGGNFRLGRELGRGGMGVVYEGLDLELQRAVAVKHMRPEISAQPAELERFLTEARLVATLAHRNIVKIHTVVREGAEVYLVFEHVDGRPLSDYLGEERALPSAMAGSVLRQAAAAVDHAHERRVIHRDLKPSNIMVTPSGAVKVMDFGIAHQARLTVAKLTRTAAWGSPPYMAPEQELGAVSRESDLYALGVTLYEMLTGTLPFTGPNFLVQKQELLFPRPSERGLPPALDAVLKRALAPLPADRFHSGRELYAAFAAAFPA